MPLLTPIGSRTMDDQDRLEVQVMCLAPGTMLPGEDHPFFTALDALAEAIAANFVRHDLATSPVRPSWISDSTGNGVGSGLTVSSDTPDWAHVLWIDLPRHPPRRQEIAGLIETHLSAARKALPDATWKVTLGGREVAWEKDAAGEPRLSLG
jgi:hypothetical protein